MRFFWCCLLSILLVPDECHAVRTFPKLELVKVEFGSPKYNQNSVFPNITPVKALPWLIGQPYGWMLYLKGDAAEGMKIRFELELPARPKSWGKNTKVSADGKTGFYSDTVNTYEEGPGGRVYIIGETWTVVEGDPLGIYTVRLYFGNSKHPFRTYKFEFVKLKITGV